MTQQPYWDRIAPGYDALYSNQWSQYENSVLKKEVADLLSGGRNIRVLDIGCGTGLGYELLSGTDRNFVYVGLDTSAAMIDHFRKRFPTAAVVQGSGEALTSIFGVCAFDLIMSINVAASFPMDTQKMLRQAFAALKPGGTIYLSFLNRWSLRRLAHCKFKQLEHYRTRGDDDPRHFVLARTYGQKELMQLCFSAGFMRPRCHYHSVLGGVWESDLSIHFERVLARTAAFLGHSIVLTAMRVSKRGL